MNQVHSKGAELTHGQLVAASGLSRQGHGPNAPAPRAALLSVMVAMGLSMPLVAAAQVVDVAATEQTKLEQVQANLARLDQADAAADDPGRYFQASGSADSDAGAYVEGDNATAAGEASNAIGDGASAYGGGAVAYALNATAIGFNALAMGDNAIALGAGSEASGQQSTALGHASAASSLVSTALGAESTASGIESTALGFRSAAAGDGATALGGESVASAEYSVAVGLAASATNTAAIAIGNGSTSSGGASVALGANARAEEYATVAIGNGASASAGEAAAIGNGAIASGSGGVSMGGYAQASGNGSIALGLESWAAGHTSISIGAFGMAWADGGIAIGNNAVVWADALNSVAIGNNSAAYRENSVSFGEYGIERTLTNVAAGTEDTDAVNLSQLNTVSDELGELADGVVHYDDADRGRITFAGADGTVLANVAAGEIGADSTDAVNGSQLHATNVRVEDIEHLIGDVGGIAANAVVYDSSDKDSIQLAGADGTRLGNLADGMVAAGSMDAVNGGQVHGALQSVADILGGGATVTAFGKISAPGYTLQGVDYGSISDAFTALDTRIGLLDDRVTSIESAPGGGTGSTPGVAVGGDGVATIGDGTNGVAVGGDAAANGQNGVAVGGDAYAHGANDTAIGGNAQVHADGSTAVGANTLITATATNAVAVGEGASVGAASGTALGQGASVIAEGAVALGQGSVADRANTVSVGSAGNTRQLTNVAAGTANTDAANVAQLNAGVTEAKAYTDTTATRTLSSANAYTDKRFAAWDDNFTAFRGDVEHRFQDVDRRIGRQGAMSAAMLNMATNAAGTQSPRGRVAVGAGFQSGESALSVGYAKKVGERASFSLGGAFSGDEASAGVGFGIDL